MEPRRAPITSAQAHALGEAVEDLYEEAPCGYLTSLPDGTIVRVNRTFLEWTGYAREALVDRMRFVELLTAGGRIYHETHYAPLLAMQGSVREIAVELRRADGSRLPVLVNSVLKRDEAGEPMLIRTTIFDATDRRRYEEELRQSRDREREMRERAERLEREADEVARILQRAMLESVALEDPRVRLGTLYQPGVGTLQVGGDWHDAFPLSGGNRVGVVVGDVVGRGIQAAAAMGQLRSATRALAMGGAGSPADVLSQLDHFAEGVPMALMTTLVYADLDLRTGEARYACAGHPPPVVLRAGGEAEVLWAGRSLPLGFPPGGDRPADGALVLAPGDRLVLYTDGLVERRGETIDVGLQRLLAAARARRALEPEPFVAAVARTLEGGDDPGDDDVCVLCLQFVAAAG